MRRMVTITSNRNSTETEILSEVTGQTNTVPLFKTQTILPPTPEN